MADDLTFYTNPMSRGRIARWMLEEVGHPYETVIVDFGPPMKAPEYRALNPMGKVPTVVHRQTVVTEGAAICAYLADAFPEAGLAPETGRRGAYYRWLFFAAGPLEAGITNQSLGVEVPKERRGMVGYGRLATMFDALEAALAGDYIAGDRFTAADVYVGGQVGWGLRVGTFEPRPAFTAYWQRLSQRPAWIRATEIDNAAIPPKAEARGMTERLTEAEREPSSPPSAKPAGAASPTATASARSGSSGASPRPGASCPAPRSPPRSSTTTPIGPTATTSST